MTNETIQTQEDNLILFYSNGKRAYKIHIGHNAMMYISIPITHRQEAIYSQYNDTKTKVEDTGIRQ